jgi:hypothetical protein
VFQLRKDKVIYWILVVAVTKEKRNGQTLRGLKRTDSPFCKTIIVAILTVYPLMKLLRGTEKIPSLPS